MMPEAVITTCGNCRFFSGGKIIADDLGRPVLLRGTCRKCIPKEGDGFISIHDPDDYICNEYRPVEEVYDNAGNSN